MSRPSPSRDGGYNKALSCTTSSLPQGFASISRDITFWHDHDLYGSLIETVQCGDQVVDIIPCIAEAASLVVERTGLQSYQAVVAPSFEQACQAIRSLRAMKVTTAFKQLCTDGRFAAAGGAFLQSVEAAVGGDLAAQLRAVVSMTVSPLIDKWLAHILDMHGITKTAGQAFPPIVINMSSSVHNTRYAQHMPGDAAPLLDCARSMGETTLFAQVAFLRDVHELVHRVAKLNMRQHQASTAEERKLTEVVASEVGRLVALVASVSSMELDMRLLSGGAADEPTEDPLRFHDLDGFGDAAALQAEVVRQGRATLEQLALSWLGDVKAASDTLRSWCPEGWTPDETLLAPSRESEELRSRLLSNPHYPQIGSAVSLLNDQIALLGLLNVNGFPALVPTAQIAELQQVSAHGTQTVVTTFSLYMIFHKLPGVTSDELRLAEVEQFKLSMKDKVALTPALVKALDDAAANTT